MKVAGRASGWVAAAALVAVAVGCEYDTQSTPVLTGFMDRDASLDLTKSFVVMRAIPDYPDGFDENRDYWGPRVLEASCPTQHLELPMEYMLWGDEDAVGGTQHLRWRVLVWETNDPYSTWMVPGEVYGTSEFHWNEDAYGYWANDVDVVMDRVAGQ
jgi:hypothetical protein